MKTPLPVRCFATSFLVFALIASVSLRGQDTAKTSNAASADAKAAIAKMLNDFLTFNSDPAQHDRFWADDLVYTTNAGKVKTKPEIMQAFADAAKPGAPKPAEPRPTYAAEDVLVRVYGDTAALTFRLVAHNPDGTTTHYRNSGALLFRHGRWQVVTWQATKEAAESK